MVVVVVGGLGFTLDHYFANAGTNTHTTTRYQLYTHLPTGLFRLALLMVCTSIFFQCPGRDGRGGGGGGKIGLEFGHLTHESF